MRTENVNMDLVKRLRSDDDCACYEAASIVEDLVRELESLSDAVWEHMLKMSREGRPAAAAMWMHRVIPARAALRRAKEES